MDGKAEGRLDHVLLRQRGAHGQHDLRDLTRQLARQLDAAAVQEQVDDRQLEAQPPEDVQGLGAAPGDVDESARASQDGRQGPGRLGILVDEED